MDDNLAIRAARQTFERALAADWDGFKALASPDYRYEDRRKGLQTSFDGADTHVKMFREYALNLELEGEPRVEIVPIAVRGDHLALFHENFFLGQYEIRTLCVQEVDAEGRLLTGILFDENELDAARAELDARSAER